MKKISQAIVLILFFSILAVPAARAVEFCSTNSFTLSESQSLTSEHWISAQTSHVDGVVNSDIFMIAETIELGGSFSNDLWAIGERVSFTGLADDQVRLAGKVVQISGTQGGLSAIGETVKCSATHCDGDLLLLGSDVIFEGRCTGDAHLTGSRITISGDFGGDVRIIANDIVISPNTHIAGNLTYTAPKELHLQNQIAIDGDLIRKLTVSSLTKSKPSLMASLFTQLMWFIAAMLVALPFIALFPSVVGESVLAIRKYSWICMLLGMAAFIIVPIFAMLTFFSWIGAPLALILLASYGILLYLAKYPMALLLGQLILRSKAPQSFKDVSIIMVVGLAAIYAAELLPFIGGTFKFIITLYGFGAILKSGIARRKPKGVLLDNGETM